MKRFFTLLMMAGVMLGASQPLMAQQKGDWNIKVGAGWFSVPDFVGALVAGLGSIDTTEGTISQDFVPMINPNVEVLCSVNDWLELGASLSVGYASAKSVFEGTDKVNKSSMALYPTLCFGVDTRYFRSSRFSMYGSWGLGVCALYGQQRSADGSSADNDNFAVAPMGNFYPLCFSYGEADSVEGFLEIGWGAKGIFNVGLKF